MSFAAPYRRCILVALAWAAFGARPASAFCRSTTCNGDCSLDDNGCKTAGTPLAWPGGCVGVSLQKDGTAQLPYAEVSQALNEALAAWSGLACTEGGASIATARLDDVSCDKTEYNPGGTNANAVIFRDSYWHYTGIANTLAFTTVTFDVDSGEIQGADIEVNSAYNHLTVGDTHIVKDLRSILTHETGHLLGIAHTPVEDATMYAYYDDGTTAQRAPHDDDLAALCAAYPPSRRVGCDPTPSGGFSDTCGGGAVPSARACAFGAAPRSSGFAGPAAAALLCASLAVRRRPRRPSTRKVS